MPHIVNAYFGNIDIVIKHTSTLNSDCSCLNHWNKGH